MKRFSKLNLLTKHLTLVLSGNIFAAGLGFLSILLISKILTVNEFGIFNIVLSVMLISSYVSCLGMDTYMITYSSSYLSKGKHAEAAQVIWVTLVLRVMISILCLLFIFYTADFFSLQFFDNRQLAPLLKLSAGGVFFISVFQCIKSIFYTYKLYKKYVHLQLLIDTVKLTSIGLLILFLKLNLFTAVIVFAFVPALGILFGFIQIRHKLFSKRRPIANFLKDMLFYSKWIFISNICKKIIPSIGIFMLAKMLNSEAAGIYGLALNLAYIFPIIIGSLKSVLLPEVSRFKEIDQFKKYLKKSLEISFYFVLLTVPFLFFSDKIILFFFGPKYRGSISVFNLLLLSYLCQAISSIIVSALYSANMPHVAAFIDLVRLPLMIVGCFFLIPFLGVLSPAILALVVNSMVLIFFIAYMFKWIQKREKFVQGEMKEQVYC